MSRKALFDFLSGLGQSAARVRSFVDGLDDAAAARLMAAAEAGDNRAVLGAMADQTWGTAPARAVPEAPAQRATRAPVSGMEWSARPDSYVQRTARDMADSLPPELAARIRAGDVEAAYEAIRRGPAKAGKKPRSTEDSIRELAKPADQVAAESIASQFDRALPPGEREAYQRMADGQSVVRRGEVSEDEYADLVTRDLAGQPFIAHARQMELPLTDQPSGMVPYGVRGPGVPGGVSGPGVPVSAGTDLIPSPPRRIGGQTRELSVVAERPYRVVDEVKPKNNRLARAAAAAALTGGAAYWALQNAGDIGRKSTAEESAVESGGEADLAAETSPPPAVAATADTPEPTVVQAPQDYSLQARALINRLNDMRRAAGGEVPEAPAMMREIERLLALGNQTRRATYVAAPQDDAGRMYQQAQALIDQVNQMYRQGMTPNSPQVQRLMAQVRQLQSQGDAMRNRRAG